MIVTPADAFESPPPSRSVIVYAPFPEYVCECVARAVPLAQPLFAAIVMGVPPSPQSMEYVAHARYSTSTETVKGSPPTAGVTETIPHEVAGGGVGVGEGEGEGVGALEPNTCTFANVWCPPAERVMRYMPP